MGRAIGIDLGTTNSCVAVMDGKTMGMSFNPGPTELIKPNDTLIVMGSVDMIAKLKKEGCSPN